MKKNLNEIFDGFTPEELDKLSDELNTEKLPDEVMSAIKDKVYAKTNIKKTFKTKSAHRTPRAVWLRTAAAAACFAVIVGAVALLPTLRRDDSGALPDASPDGGDASTTTTTTQKDNVPKTPSGVGISSGEPPIAVYFSSPERISEFIEISNDSDEKYETYCREQDIFGVTLKNAQVVAHNLGIIKIPLISDYDDFNVKYNLTSNIFDAIYTVGEVRYRFIYYFNSDTEIPDLTERPIYKENMTLGDYSITLYSSAEQDSLSGFYKDNLVNVRVIIYTENFENISLDSIEFKPVDSIK